MADWQIERIPDSVGDGDGGDMPMVYWVVIPPDATPEQREDPEDHFAHYSTREDAEKALAEARDDG